MKLIEMKRHFIFLNIIETASAMSVRIEKIILLLYLLFIKRND